MNIIDDGRLTTWVLDLSSARQLGLESTGHAARGTSSPPSPSTSNLYMEPGRLSPAELMADIQDGFYVTSLMGMGINGVRSEEHTSELQSLMRISYADFCLKKKKNTQ